MQIFSKNLIERPTVTSIRDRYDQEVEQTKNKVIKMESLNLTEYSTTKEALQFYSRGAILISLGVITSAFSYPFSVRIAKRVFRLKNFLNIHMAALPIIMNINAFVLGIAQGGMNYYYLTYRYPAKEEANIFARHLQL